MLAIRFIGRLRKYLSKDQLAINLTWWSMLCYVTLVLLLLLLLLLLLHAKKIEGVA